MAARRRAQDLRSRRLSLALTVTEWADVMLLADNRGLLGLGSPGASSLLRSMSLRSIQHEAARLRRAVRRNSHLRFPH